MINQLDFLNDATLLINDIDNIGLSFQLKKLIYLFDNIPLEVKNFNLTDELANFVGCALQKGSYKGSDFILIADKLINHYKYSCSNKYVILAISYLCQIHFSFYEIYYKYNIANLVGKYFSLNWRYYSCKKNTTIDDLIYEYYKYYFSEFIISNPTAIECIDVINKQDYLNDDCGLYLMKSIIIWLYDNYFKDKDDGLVFLENFGHDKTIKKKLDFIHLKNNH